MNLVRRYTWTLRECKLQAQHELKSTQLTGGNMLDKLKNLVRASIYRRNKNLDMQTWIFSSADNNNFNYNSKYLFLYVKENCPHIRALYVINDSRRRAELEGQYGEGCFIDGGSHEGLKTILEAGVWFTSAGLPAYELRCHPRRIVVNLWHGIPLKKIALMEENQSIFRKMYFRRMFSDKYTYILTTSRELVPIMAESFAVPAHKVKVWGQPRNDMLWERSKKAEIEKALGISGADKLILYAPTYREYGQTRLFPFAEYNREQLEDYLKQRNWHICLRTHLEEQGSSKEYESPHVHFLNNDVVEDVALWLNGFDLLITDYSSIYLDYLLLNRPMIFLAYDKEEYLHKRGMNFPYDEVTPGEKPRTWEAFLDALERGLNGADMWVDRRAGCNEFFNDIAAPCCERIVEEVEREITSGKHQ